MKQLVLVRHGESVWNQENRFTGWVDVPLSQKGLAEAAEAGRRLKSAGYTFDLAHTSLLKRAIKTLWLTLEEMDLMWIPVTRAWQLNERHYGSLSGLNKAETAALHGEAQVKIWRRSYDIPPPAFEPQDAKNPSHDRRYAGLAAHEKPMSESLKDTVARVVPYWEREIVPQLKAGKRVLVAAHGNSLRALVKHLDRISDQDIVELNIPTGVPKVYELSDDLQPLKSFYLADAAELAAREKAVAEQGKAKK
ncbi:MAG: 2,3-diphosphoglycerate-dependent phosphoglycerate mutase [Planctomycetes bacterium]|nr:2,3-diphosphoglycerate-dependent phosphoglycerate mutase [Planctomycetota bacterium]